VRIADTPPLDQLDDRHARRQLPFLGLHAQDARIRALERIGRPATASISTASVGAWCSASAASRLAATVALAWSAINATRSPACIPRQVPTALRAPRIKSEEGGPNVINSL
jgi:hypothetical protein